MASITFQLDASPDPWDVGGTATKTSVQLTKAATVHYADASSDALPAATPAVLPDTTSVFDRTTDKYILYTVKGSGVLSVIKESSVSTISGDYAHLATVLRNQVVPSPAVISAAAAPASGLSGFEFVVDGGGSTPSTGVAGALVIPFACTLTAVELFADQVGSIVIDIWKSDYAGYPPNVANTITGASPPTISSAIKSADTTLSGWTTTINGSDVLVFNVNSVTTITRCAVRLTYNTIPQDTTALEFVLDGGGSALASGTQGPLLVPFNCTITSVELLADQSGSVTVDIWKSDYAGYPPSGANSITAADIPAISTAQKSQDTALTGWTTGLLAGDALLFDVSGVTAITRCSVVLTVQRATPTAATVPAAKAYSNANTVITNSSNATLAFEKTDYDQGTTSPQHDNVTNNERLTCQVAGVYAIAVNLVLLDNSDSTITSGPIFVQLFHTSPAYSGPIAAEVLTPILGPFYFPGCSLSAQVALAVGDYVWARVYNYSGGTITVSADPATVPMVTVPYLAWTKVA